MSLEVLQVIWFILIAVLWTGYFFLEGFDFGVGIIFRFISKDDIDRRVAINTIGPVWDGNEVWLLTAGGATFAAFPEWYATLFTTFYFPLFIILISLIYRGVAFDYRHKIDNPKWRELWDWGIFIGSVVPALLWGVAFANILRGLDIVDFEYQGGFFDLLNPYALLGGLVTLSLFTLHGAVFLALKSRGDIADRARALAIQLAIPVAVITGACFAWTLIAGYHNLGGYVIVALVLVAVALALIIAVRWLVAAQSDGKAFIASGVSIILVTVTIFAALFPNVMPSIHGASEHLTVWNASSTQTTLTIMTIVAVLFVPIIIGYQSWSYWVFRQRVDRDTILGATKGPVELMEQVFGKQHHS
ncbi:cytochrome d ubiquinol oxidase subunit II [Stomatohabitans albus]|uniref:cytochrome d ubiquinol oxidase subunit II n=1 Tax=Stomatohabitans albus TaxID=3110766 RepID=UPI00300CC7C0